MKRENRTIGVVSSGRCYKHKEFFLVTQSLVYIFGGSRVQLSSQQQISQSLYAGESNKFGKADKDFVGSNHTRYLKKNLNALRPSEHPPVREKKWQNIYVGS